MRISKLTIMLLAMICVGCVQNPSRFEQAKLAYEQKDYDHTIARLKSDAEDGDSRAQYALGYMYFYGQGVEKNIDTAKQWIRMSAAQQYAPARRALNLITQDEAAYME